MSYRPNLRVERDIKLYLLTHSLANSAALLVNPAAAKFVAGLRADSAQQLTGKRTACLQSEIIELS